MSIGTVTKNTTYLLMAYVGQKVLSFFYFIMVARFIGVEDLGKYTFALSFTTIFAVFVDLGLTQALIREVAKFKEKSKKYLSAVLGFKFSIAILVYLVVVLMINLLNYPSVTKNLVYVSGIIMLLDSFVLTFWGTYRGWQNLKYEAIGIIISQVLILGSGLAVLFLRLPLIYLMLPFLLSSSFLFIFSAILVRKKLKIKYLLKWDKKVLKFLFKIALPFFLIAGFSRIYGYMDMVLLSKFSGDKFVGWYSVSMKIPFALQFIPAAFAAAIFPAFSSYYVSNKEQLKVTFNKVMKFLMIFAIPISIGVAVLADKIILTLYGIEYEPSILPLQILMMSLVFVFLNFPLGSLLNGCDKQVTNTVLVGCTMVLNVILNLILIPKYHFIGASFAFLVCHSLLFLASLVVARKIIKYNLKGLVFNFIKTFLAALIMGVVIYFLKPQINWLVLILIGGVVYFVSLFLVKGFYKKDLVYLKEIFLKK